jgi:hypothetical protein
LPQRHCRACQFYNLRDCDAGDVIDAVFWRRLPFEVGINTVILSNAGGSERQGFAARRRRQ